MRMMQIGQDVFEAETDLLDVTSSSRPDTSWMFTDAAGHEHRWYDIERRPAESYNPSGSYILPTLVWVQTGTGHYEDGDEFAIGEYRCLQCSEVVSPRTTADTTRQMVPGLRRYRINGESVSEPEFQERYTAAMRAHEGGQ